MREIKFRGKTKQGDWVYGSLQNTRPYMFDKILYNYVGITTQTFITGGRIWHQGVYLVKKETVGQYTGLKDKNGKEIYEGDILERFGYKVIILFNDGSFCYTKGNEIISLNDCEFPLEEKECEVIGNIYDNPELVEKVVEE